MAAPPIPTRVNGSTTAITIRGGGGVQHAEADSKRMELDEEDKDQDRTIRGLEDLPRHSVQDSRAYHRKEQEDEDTAMEDVDSNKDLFLSLAKADPPKLGLNTRNRIERVSGLSSLLHVEQ